MTRFPNTRPAPGVISQPLGSETVLFDIESERYFSLDEIGGRAWRLLVAGADFDAICRALLADYEVDATQLEADLDALFRELQDGGLIIPGSV